VYGHHAGSGNRERTSIFGGLFAQPKCVGDSVCYCDLDAPIGNADMDSASLDVVYVTRSPWELGWDACVGLGTLALAIATLITVYYSWKAERVRQEEMASQVANTNVTAANRTIFLLTRTLNVYKNIQDQLINPFRGSHGRHLEIRPLVAALEPIQIDFDALSFLFDSDDRDVLQELDIIQRQIASTVQVIDDRNDLHKNHVQPIIEKAGIPIRTLVDGATVESALGERITHTLVQATNYLIEGVDDIVVSCERAIDQLYKATKKLYPARRVISIKFAEQAKT